MRRPELVPGIHSPRGPGGAPTPTVSLEGGCLEGGCARTCGAGMPVSRCAGGRAFLRQMYSGVAGATRLKSSSRTTKREKLRRAGLQIWERDIKPNKAHNLFGGMDGGATLQSEHSVQHFEKCYYMKST